MPKKEMKTDPKEDYMIKMEKKQKQIERLRKGVVDLQKNDMKTKGLIKPPNPKDDIEKYVHDAILYMLPQQAVWEQVQEHYPKVTLNQFKHIVEVQEAIIDAQVKVYTDNCAKYNIAILQDIIKTNMGSTNTFTQNITLQCLKELAKINGVYQDNNTVNNYNINAAENSEIYIEFK